MNIDAPSTYVDLMPGDPCPWLRKRQSANQLHCGLDDGVLPPGLDQMAGRYVVLCFYASAGEPSGRAAIDAMLRHRSEFDDERACFFGVSIDSADKAEKRVEDKLPGVRFFWDLHGMLSRLCGALPRERSPAKYRSFWLVLDPTLHVLAKFLFSDLEDVHAEVFAYLTRLPYPRDFAGFNIPAPVLILPNVFEPQLCRHLISLYEAKGGTETGTISKPFNPAVKRRKDCDIVDQDTIRRVQTCIQRRVAPEVERLFFMKITRIERHIVGCYTAEDGGHFSPHRDNTDTKSAHRRFAVSINLNDDFSGGEVRFPEYSTRGHKAPAGWAVVFPCAILHMVTKVTSGRRYAFLPFVFDEQGAQVRAANRED